MKIEDICTRICSGGTPKSSKAEYYENGTIPWLNTKEINFNRIQATETFITEEGLNNSSAKWIKPHAVIVAMYGATAGRVAVAETPLTTNQACCNLEVDETIADYRYVYYWLKQNFDSIAGLANGGAQQNLSAKVIRQIEINLPDLIKQRSIANFLDSFDSKIETNAKLNGYLEELFDSYFKQSLNMVDETWDTASLLDIADYKNGLAMQKFRPNIGDKGLPVLKIRELGQESCGKDAERCRSDIDESVTVHDGDLVFSWSGTLLLRFWAGGDAGLNQHLFKVTSGVYPSWFYYAWTKHHLARFTMLAKDRATTMGHIKRSALEESEVLLPPKEKLAMQTKCMQPIIDQVIANKIEIRKLAALRDTLLPKLMSGEIDVSKIDLTQLNSHLA